MVVEGEPAFGFFKISSLFVWKAWWFFEFLYWIRAQHYKLDCINCISCSWCVVVTKTTILRSFSKFLLSVTHDIMMWETIRLLLSFPSLHNFNHLQTLSVYLPHFSTMILKNPSIDNQWGEGGGVETRMSRGVGSPAGLSRLCYPFNFFFPWVSEIRFLSRGRSFCRCNLHQRNQSKSSQLLSWVLETHKKSCRRGWINRVLLLWKKYM